MKTLDRLVIGLALIGLSACAGAVTDTAGDDLSPISLARTPSQCPALPPGTSSLLIAPNTAAIGVGATGDLQVTNQAGAVVADCNVKWISSDTRVATVNATGLVAAIKAGGPIAIRASTSTKPTMVGSASITISAVRVAAVSVAPVSLVRNATALMTATVAGADGRPLANRIVRWTSVNPDIATVDEITGVVTGRAVGTASITATSEGVRGSATVTVSEIAAQSVTITPASTALLAGQTIPLVASAVDGAGAVLSGKSFSWSSDRPDVAAVTTSGVVTAVAPGTATIAAAVDGKIGTATVTVALVPVRTVTVSPSAGTVHVGQTLPLSASAQDSIGGSLTGRPVTWSSLTPSVATISAQGVVTGVAPGTATINATVEGKTGTATITVTPVPVQSVTVTPGTGRLYAGQALQLSAVVKDGSGNVLTDRPVTWASSNAGGATVSSTGLVVGVSPAASVLVTATAGGVSGSATIAVVSEIVYQRDASDWVNNSGEEIWVVRPDGTGDTRLTFNSSIDQRAVLSPDGMKIVFSSDIGKSYAHDGIWIMDRDGSNRVALTPEYTALASYPAWSRDGKKIAFSSQRSNIGSDVQHLVIMNPDGTGKIVLDSNSTSHSRFHPAWSPDGSKIYHSANNGWPYRPQIWVVNADGTNFRQLFSSSANELIEAGSVSPDGSKILFTSDRDGNREVYVMNNDGTNQQRLTFQAGDDMMPCWSPDGTRIAFVSTRSGTAQIWIMNADGSNPVRLNTGTDWAYLPFWR